MSETTPDTSAADAIGAAEVAGTGETAPTEAAGTTEDSATTDTRGAAKIDFDRADFAEPASGQVECGICGRAITTEYWQYLGKVLCDQCREAVRQTTTQARRGATLGKAALLGGVVAIGCGVGYAIFVGVTHIQFALVTIGIGWAVGRSIQRVTRGFGGQRHQVLAVALTYFATSMGYFPALLEAMSKAPSHSAQSAESGAATPATPSPDLPSSAPAGEGSEATRETTRAPGQAGGSPRPEASSGSVLAAIALVIGIMLAAPFLDISSGLSGLLGLLIMFFGLRMAWRVSKGVEGAITGPHQVGASAGS